MVALGSNKGKANPVSGVISNWRKIFLLYTRLPLGSYESFITISVTRSPDLVLRGMLLRNQVTKEPAGRGRRDRFKAGRFQGASLTLTHGQTHLKGIGKSDKEYFSKVQLALEKEKLLKEAGTDPVPGSGRNRGRMSQGHTRRGAGPSSQTTGG